MRAVLSFMLLVAIREVSRVLYRHRMEWVGGEPANPWSDIRVITILNHTSLYEPLLAGFAPLSLLWQLANHGVVPIAEKTMRRKVGMFFRFLGRYPVILTRRRDETWDRLLNRIDSRSLVVILPEGRMKRRNGLDSEGLPMTLRGGIADILRVCAEGKMLVVYSGGLHHIQAPGDLLPRPFRAIDARLERVDIPTFRRGLLDDVGEEGFKAAIVADLTHRRDTLCPTAEHPLAASAG